MAVRNIRVLAAWTFVTLGLLSGCNKVTYGPTRAPATTASSTSASPETSASTPAAPVTSRRTDSPALPPVALPSASSPAVSTDVAHAFPIDASITTSWTPRTHHDYPATDVFASTGCGTRLHAMVTGTVSEVLTNRYDPNVNDPATRGGNAIAIIGDDGVRYYMAHFQQIDPTIRVGLRVEAGHYLGLLGETGLAGACHVHIGLSLPCPKTDWWVRRGVIWPDDYLASWKSGGNASPVAALHAWFAAHPSACNSPADTPYPIG